MHYDPADAACANTSSLACSKIQSGLPSVVGDVGCSGKSGR